MKNYLLLILFSIFVGFVLSGIFLVCLSFYWGNSDLDAIGGVSGFFLIGGIGGGIGGFFVGICLPIFYEIKMKLWNIKQI